MIKLLATDLDGTIVRKDGTISDRVRQALQACQDAGIAICVATGRVKMSVVQMGQEYTICHGGTLVTYGESTLLRVAMSVDQACRAWRWAAQNEVPAIFFGEESWSANYQDDHTAALTRFLGAAPGGEPCCEIPLARLNCPANDLLPHFPDLDLEQEGDWTYLRARPADKGTALLALLEHLGLTPDEVICFGDELNDLSMFAVAGHRIAVENARPELKALATRVAPGVEEDGVAQVLEELLGP